jgi:hypothetical protein
MKKNNMILYVASCWLVLLYASTEAFADVNDLIAESEAPSIRLGGVKAYPGLAIIEKNDTNIHLSDISKVSSTVTVLSPSVLFQQKQDANTYALSYNLDAGYFAQSATDNYVDQDLLGVTDFSLSTRAGLRFVPEYKLGHDPVGSTYGANITPNTWQNSGIAGQFNFGSEDAPAGFAIDLAYQDREYQNNQAVTFAYNKIINNAGGTFNYRLAPKLTSFFQVSDTSFVYKDSATASNLNSREQRYMLGVTWDKTVQTKGSFKIGDLQKQFASSSRPTSNLISWEGNVRWSPREFIRVDLDTSKTPLESTLTTSSFELITDNSVTIGYDLSSLTSLQAVIGNMVEEFIAANPYRKDTSNRYSIKADYKIESWLSWGVEYTNSIKTSTDPNVGYHRDVIMISLRTQL